MSQTLQEFVKNKTTSKPVSSTTPAKILPQTLQEFVNKSTGLTTTDVLKQMPSAIAETVGKPLRWIGKQLMKPSSSIAVSTEQVGKAIGEQSLQPLKEIPAKVGSILTGKTERDFVDIWRENLIPLMQKEPSTSFVKNLIPELTATTIGTIFNIAVDPLNFIGGITTKGLEVAGKGLKVAEKIASKIPLMKDIKPMFSTKTSDEVFNALVDEYKSLGEYRKANVIKEAKSIQQEVSKLPKEDIIKVSNYLEKAPIVEGIPKSLQPPEQIIKKVVGDFSPEITKLGERLKNTYNEYKILEKEMGIKGGELSQYAPHIKSKVPLLESVKNVVSPIKQWSTKLGGAEKTREILKFVSNNGDELVGRASDLGLLKTELGYLNKTGKIFQSEQASIEEVANAFNKTFFEENPAIQMAYRGVAHAKAITSKEFFNSVNKFASKSGIETKVPDLKGLKFPEDIAGQIDNYYKSIQPPEAKNVFKIFDATQNWWKGQVLISPSYHIRNTVGNIWNNYLAGVKNPISYIKAGLLQTGKDVNVAGKTGKEILELAQKRGVINEGWYAADIPSAIESGIKSTWKQGVNPLSQQNYAFKLNRNLGSVVENNARLAHFIELLDKGKSVDDAVLSVKKYLFDYQDLTAFEQSVLKRVMPFYTWTRKNIPLQLENLIKQPGTYAGLEKVIKAVETIGMGNAKPANEKYLSDYVKGNTAMRVKYNEKEKTYYYFLLGNWLPSYQAMDFLAQPLNNIMSLATPLIKTPIELFANKSTFFRDTLGTAETIEKYPGETTNFLGFNMPKKTAIVLRNLRLLNELDKLNPGKIFGGSKGEPSIFQGMPAVETPFGIISPSKYKYGQTSTKSTQTERLANTFLGQFQAYKERTARENYQYETQQRITEMKTEIKAAAKKGDKERIKILNEQLKEFVKSRGG